MSLTKDLQRELNEPIKGTYAPYYFRYMGFREAIAEAPAAFRAHGVYTLFTRTTPVILKNELIVGNRFCLYVDKDPDFLEQIKQRIGTLFTHKQVRSVEVRGRSAQTGLPQVITLSSREMLEIRGAVNEMIAKAVECK